MRMLAITLGIFLEKSHFSKFSFSLSLCIVDNPPDGGANVLNGEYSLNFLSGIAIRIVHFWYFVSPLSSLFLLF